MVNTDCGCTCRWPLSSVAQVSIARHNGSRLHPTAPCTGMWRGVASSRYVTHHKRTHGVPYLRGQADLGADVQASQDGARIATCSFGTWRHSSAIYAQAHLIALSKHGPWCLYMAPSWPRRRVRVAPGWRHARAMCTWNMAPSQRHLGAQARPDRICLRSNLRAAEII